jgi:DNA-binding NarL/FixJ family response regulator
MEPARIIIADPLALIAEGVRSWLRDEPGFRVVGHAATGNALLHVLREMPCDLVLMEVSLPDKDGIDTMRSVKRCFPEIRVLAFSELTEIEYVNSMLIEGASGYLIKGGPQEELVRALHETLNGGRYISLAARHSIDQGYAYTAKHPGGEYIGLTDREREIIRSIALERTNAEIAAQLFISEETVKSHRKHLMTKLNVRSSAGLVRYALHRRWI